MVACDRPKAGGGRAPAATATPAARPLQLRSAIPSLRIVNTARLPDNPTRAAVDDYCSSYVMPRPATAGGRLAATKGWIVTSETQLGALDAVTFVSRLEPATSGTCVHRDGNLALFAGPTLRAIAYRTTDPDGSDDDTLGSAQQIGPSQIRLYYGLPSPPLADVVAGPQGIAIQPVAAADPVCGGKAEVPNVFGMPIAEARQKLIAAGWEPVRPDEDPGSSNPLGFPEVNYCSGTGYGFCAYTYRHRRGIGLRVTSGGEDYRIYDANPSCSGR